MMREKPPVSWLQKRVPVSFMNKAGASITELFWKLFSFLKPDPVVWKGAGWGLGGIVIILLIVMAGLMLKSLGVPVAVLLILYFIGSSILAATGIYFGLKLITLIPAFYRFMLFAALAALVIFWTGNTAARILLIIYTVLTGSILGGVLAVLLIRKWNAMAIGKKILNLVIVVFGAGALAFGFTWLFLEGFKSDPPDNTALMSEYRPAHITLQDPSVVGEYTVLELTYGSGNDKHRSEFGENVTIRTDSVDGSRYVSNWEKLHGWVRSRYWGFDDKALPLNARVWYPGGKGPFPLVLIVHGNHGDREFSDPGYEYLGRLMASRGFIFASVDENFLNGAWYDLFDHLKTENDCRAWLLLKHLELWRAWDRDPKNPFYGKVDMENIGLIGHSRGGEAVAIAACFNRLPHNPDDATLAFDFDFNLRSVIAIAPVDGQYKPAGTGTILEDINYFVIQGSNDMHLRTYEGTRQFHRTEFNDEAHHFKAGLYVFGANHGQFNTIWGRNDNSFPFMALFNKRQIMPGEDQEKIGKVFISAFLESTLNGKAGYFDLFRDYRSGINWLPETVYLTHYEDPACEFVCTFDEDLNVLTTTLEGGEIQSENLTVWKEGVVPLKWGTQATRAVYAGWNLEETDSLPGVLSIRQQDVNQISTDENSYLYFVMADAKENPNPHPEEEEEENPNKKENSNKQADESGSNEESVDDKEETEDKEKKGPIDLTIILVDSAGQAAALPLSAYSYLSRQLEPKLMKADFMTDVAKSDLVFQVFFYPLSTFREQNSRLDIGYIQEIRFVFDRTEEGVVVIDNIGFWKDQVNAAF
jgi:dienelactone hydrolase